MAWTGENRPQIARTAQTAKNACFVFFLFSVEGIVAKIVIPKGTTVIGNLYANKILPEVFSKFKEMRVREVLFKMSCFIMTMQHHILQKLLQST